MPRNEYNDPFGDLGSFEEPPPEPPTPPLGPGFLSLPGWVALAATATLTGIAIVYAAMMEIEEHGRLASPWPKPLNAVTGCTEVAPHTNVKFPSRAVGAVPPPCDTRAAAVDSSARTAGCAATSPDGSSRIPYARVWNTA